MKLYYTQRATRSLNNIYEFLCEKSSCAAAIIHIEEKKIYIVDIWDCRRAPEKLQMNIP